MKNLFPTWLAPSLLLWMAVASSSAFAARPLNTDDANVVDPQSCQDESWVKKSKMSIERWIVPGCNFFADTEISLGVNFQSETGSPSSQFHLMQAKKRWRVLEPDSWGISTTLGTLKHTGLLASDTVNDVYLNVPITWSIGQDRYTHINVGWVKHQQQGYGAKTWGIGFEQPFNKQVIGILETYGEERQSSKYQVGLRFWIVPQRVQIDTTLGNVWGASGNAMPSQRWVSVGLRLLSPPLY
jgi:hypothetical protein